LTRPADRHPLLPALGGLTRPETLARVARRAIDEVLADRSPA
jgi:hypothetical protein